MLYKIDSQKPTLNVIPIQGVDEDNVQKLLELCNASKGICIYIVAKMLNYK
jgi:hypothetical protein